MNIAICDDNPADLEYMTKIIYQAFDHNRIICNMKTYTNAGDLLEANQIQLFDVVFLDLDMPEMSGMEAAAQLNKLHEATEIVFITNHDELVYKAYRFKALGFIRKKFLNIEIDEIVEALIESINAKEKYIIFCGTGYETKYNINDILYMRSDDHYIDIFSVNKKESLRGSLNHIEKNYSQYGFIRIHSRYLVNYRYIYSIEKNTVVLNDLQQLPMSRSRVKAVKEAFQLFSRRIL